MKKHTAHYLYFFTIFIFYTFRNIQNETLCPQLAAECCQFLLYQVQSDFENSIHYDINDVCDVMYQPECPEESE